MIFFFPLTICISCYSELLADSKASGTTVAALLEAHGPVKVEVKRINGTRDSTAFIKVVIPGISGRLARGGAPTIGNIGRLIGARPGRVGLVSDANGAVGELLTGS